MGAIGAKVDVETAGVREMAQGDEGREGKWAEDGQVPCLRVKVQAKGEESAGLRRPVGEGMIQSQGASSGVWPPPSREMRTARHPLVWEIGSQRKFQGPGAGGRQAEMGGGSR